ncbi:MAG: DUF4062 domain-containing protein [Saprospiraceae bacterium]
MSTEVKKAMISSTARDLPEHRKQVEEACHRMGVFAEQMMENLSAEDATAVEVSLRLVDEADVYIGIFAFRYGFVPDYDNPTGISITEMEYHRATARGIPRLVFFMHDDHPVKKSDVETGPGAEKLEALKKRIGNERVAAFFASPEDLRAHAVQALSQQKAKWAEQQPATAAVPFQHTNPMTLPPEPYVAHPYTLSQAAGFVGRQSELDRLTEWVAGKNELATVRVFNVVAIGGMGKSALTWEWFSRTAPHARPDLSGRFWWSFYESDAHFENFVIRALAYVSHSTPEAVRMLPPTDRENALLQILDREPYLFVLDGLERILAAYARMDAAHLTDDDFDRQAASSLAPAAGVPGAFADEHRLRKTAEPRAGRFLKQLTQLGASRVLVSSRLFPFDLQQVNGDPLPGCGSMRLQGLSDDDALALWQHFGISGKPEDLLPLFHTFQSHPLLLQALAGEVARWRPAPGDFHRWQAAKPDFDPFSLPLGQLKNYILLHAMEGLSATERAALRTIAAFRMPAQYDALCALLIGAGKPCAGDEDLDTLLNHLEDRGLVGWDRRANRYDLHPVVRGLVWSEVPEEERLAIYSALRSYFEAVPKVKKWSDVYDLNDLTPDIELYYTLVGLQRYRDAYQVFRKNINKAMMHRFGLGQLRLELLQELANSSQIEAEFLFFNDLALALKLVGRVQESIPYFQKFIELAEGQKDKKYHGIGLYNLSNALRFIGKLKESEQAAARSSQVFEKFSQVDRLWFLQKVALEWQGLALAVAGNYEDANTCLTQSLTLASDNHDQQSECFVLANMAECALLAQELPAAKQHADLSWELAAVHKHERDFIRAARLQGQTALALGDSTTAEERLYHALSRARAINFVEEELPALAALAELARRQGDLAKAREHLGDLWEAAEHGPYPLVLADAQNVLSQIESDAGNTAAATEAASRAYRHAWCDGPPWAYHFGLEKARMHLLALGGMEPKMGEAE